MTDQKPDYAILIDNQSGRVKPKRTQPQIPTERQGRDFFRTPNYATNLLIPFIPKDVTSVWEAAYGDGKISGQLRLAGYTVFESDIQSDDPSKVFNFLSDIKSVPEKISIITNPPFCYDSTTEALTNNGWKLISDITVGGDKVLSIDTVNLQLSWEIVADKFISDYSGAMVHFKNKLMDLMVTPNHRMFVKTQMGETATRGNIYGDGRIPGSDALPLASMVSSNHCFIRNGFKWKNINPVCDYFTIPSIDIIYNKRDTNFPEIKVNIDNWCSFLGLWIAEGYSRGSTKDIGYNHKGKQKHLYEIGIKQKEPKATEVRNLLAKLPFKVSEYLDISSGSINFSISNVQLWSYLHTLGNSRTKHIPNNIKDLSVDKLKLFFDWYMFGDGCKSPISNSSYFYTVSKKLADDLSEISVKIGNFITLHKDSIGGYRGVLASQRYAHIDKHMKKLVNYTGKIACITLCNNNVFLVRRNGKMAFSGNSLKEKFYLKCLEYRVPFALLIPADYSGWVIRAIQNGSEKVIPTRRIDYITPSGKGSGAQFHSLWLCHGFNIGKSETFVELSIKQKKEEI